MRFGDLRFGLSRLAPLAAGVCLAVSLLSVAATPAQARHHRHAQHVHSVAPTSAPAEVDPSKFSAIVVDANTGQTLWSVNENALRHPASITKVMTLYLLFEQLENGTLSLTSRIPISEHAAAQEPSKLGLSPGETISVEDAIKAIVTRSANDIAVAVAEAIGRDETTFAAMMTRKAHQLGMSRTLYRDASGLPNDEQLTTARDLALLGRSLQERFPQYYHYFSLHEFTYDGEVIGNHNHLLGRVEGVDGIKTGYTRASGFNLLTSVHRADGRALIAVVMGGRSAPARDRLMERLIAVHLANATPKGATRLAEAADDSQPPAGREPVRYGAVAEREEVADVEPQSEGDNSDEDSVKPAPAPAKRLVAATKPKSAILAKAAKLDPAKLGWKTGAPGKILARKEPAKKTQDAEETKVARSDDDEDAPASPKKGNWVIQVGATDDADDARDLLARAKSRHRALASVRGFTEKVRKGGDTLYRVRFAGLDSASAQKACRDLKHGGLACFATQD
jgi:D-alanyl-D-alanine carboxypeptidase